MPYLRKDRVASRFAEIDAAIDAARIETEGDLNYLFSRLAAHYLRKHPFCYATMNQIDGAFGLAQAEFRRRIVYPYEDFKIDEDAEWGPANVDPYAEFPL